MQQKKNSKKQYFNILKKKGYEILYAGDVVVHHHRRETIKKHLKQMFIYGRDIAWLAKEEFSPNMLYFSLLSLFVIGFFGGIVLSIFYPIVKVIFARVLLIYFLIMLSTSIHKNLKISVYVFLVSIITHFAYGLGFIGGIVVRNKNEIHVR